jgi:hypothetical protein
LTWRSTSSIYHNIVTVLFFLKCKIEDQQPDVDDEIDNSQRADLESQATLPSKNSD